MNLARVFRLPEQVRLLRRTFSVYFILGHTSLALSLIINLYLCYYIGLSYALCVSLYIVALFVFYGLAFVSKALLGYEHYVLLRYSLVVNVVLAIMLWYVTASTNEYWHYLDLFAIALALMIVIGRVGCQTVGCCHGKPCNWKFYTAYGFKNVSEKPLVRFVPIQLIEACFAFFLCGLGVFYKLINAPAGIFFIAFWSLYAVGRYVFEFYRGDPDRPYWKGFSEAQWVCIGISCFVMVVKWVYAMPLVWWVTSAILVSIHTLIFLHRVIYQKAFYRLSEPKNLMEFSQKALQSRQSKQVKITSQQIKISCTELAAEQYLYTLSHVDVPLPRRWAKCLFRYLQYTMHPTKQIKMDNYNKGVYHLIILPQKVEG
ncbi:prolipoprotein diacylglyceryl transferase family protein [Microscilla marina]|uniref:Membrane protein, putative n=1 Tax=Microscilla marina ATCC 23134 TaxID=313606 RepID=A1ZUT7_MICM2|nr:prolipoprotein diacylglyceryl transferase family protein [Microscilla marina]EAY25841.1 membrane protein, putative [Microscilla marina ATCC 23134]